MISAGNGERGPIASAALLRAVAIVIRVFVGLIFARLLGAAEVGVFFLALALSGFAALFARAGLDRLALAEIGRNPDDAMKIAMTLGRYVLVGSAAMAIPASAALLILSGRSDLQASAMVPAMIAVVPLNLSQFAAHVLRGSRKIASSIFIGELCGPALRLVIFLALPLELNATRATVAYLMAWVVTAVIGISVVKLTTTAPNTNSDWALTDPWRQTRPLFVFALNTQLRESYATALAWLVGTPVEVGALGASTRFDRAVLLPTTATRFATAPKLASSGSTMLGSVVWLATRTAQKAMVVQLPMLVAGFVFAPELLGILGSDFRTGSDFVRVLIVGSFINALTGSTTQSLLMSDQRHRLGTSSTAGSIILVVLSLVLSPFMGVLGIAVAMAAANAFVGIFEWWIIREELNARVDILVRRQKVDA